MHISPQNAIPEFRQLLDRNLGETQSAFSQLGKIIRNYIKNSMGDSGYRRAVETMGVMREEALDLEVPELYNEFVRELKTDIFNEELGGDRRDMWFLIRANRMGLIQSKEVSASGVGEDEAKDFLSARLGV
jgi:ATP-dependent DNA helicase 2 subunit 2